MADKKPRKKATPKPKPAADGEPKQKLKSVKTFADEMVHKRLDILADYFDNNRDIIKKWEQLKLEWETAKFKREYIKKNEPWKRETSQLTLFGDD